ncbi:MAG TPA: SDR family NAD(P)-dependent oxidoreductase [Candidatus Dormibacteraeota bacterium]|nr:SDR family NAD(P)-dependent oxidoreductase [Candidatus Dormibacteraeota bacterium]
MKPLADSAALITGATDGLGRALVHALAPSGAQILVHGRDQARCQAVIEAVRSDHPAARLQSYVADFTSLAQVRRLAEEIARDHQHLDLLINNAGIGGGKRPGAREVSADGHELRFQVNYLAPFLLTRLLLPLIRRSAPARIVNVASVGQAPVDFDDVMLQRRYDGMRAYCQSKLALIAFTFDLAEELAGTGITVNALHPASLMDTKMVIESFGRAMTTVDEGLRATLRLATSPELDDVSGRYFDQTREARAHTQANDPAARRRLRELTELLVGLPRGTAAD